MRKKNKKIQEKYDNEILGLVEKQKTPEEAVLNDPPLKQQAKEDIAKAFGNIATNSNKLIELIHDQMREENNTRNKLISFFKRLLIALLIVPMLLFGGIYHFFEGEVDLGKYIIIYLIAVPIEVIGVFHVIASKLFDDPYRKTIPKMLAKFIQDLRDY